MLSLYTYRTQILTTICLYSVPMKVNGTYRVTGLDALSSPVGPRTSPAVNPNDNNSILGESVVYK